MPYNGAGSYSPPAPQYPAIPGNIIYAEDFNTVIADIAAGLSLALPRDGQAAMTGNLNFGGFGINNLATIAAQVAGTTCSGTFTYSGTLNVPTQANGTGGTLAASCQFVLNTAMNAALPGQAGKAGYILMTDGTNARFDNTLTIALNEALGASIASAATINLTTATGNYVHVIGSVGITAITIPAGAERTVVFDGAPLLTNSANLLLPGRANIQAAAGDVMKVRGEAGGVANVISYNPASGKAVSAVNPGSVLLATLNTSNVANLDLLTVFSANPSYNRFLIQGTGIMASTAVGDSLQYRFANAGVVDSGNNYFLGTTGQTQVNMFTGWSASGTNRACNFELFVDNAQSASASQVKSATGFVTGYNTSVGGSSLNNIGNTVYINNAAISGIRLFLSAGALFATGGVIKVYGLSDV